MTPSWTESPYDFQPLTKVVMVLDVMESVRLMEQDERGFVQHWHAFVEQFRSRLAECGGRMHKSLGDGLMLEFDDAGGAMCGAFAAQELSQRLNEGLPPVQHMHLRIGAHLCEYVADEWDIYGTGVNLTARIASLAGPGEIVITAALRDQLTGGLDADIEDLGDCHLKHVKDPVRTYRIGPVGSSAVIEPGTGVEVALRPAIAVIPFSIRSGEASHRLLGEALADEIIAALSRTSELHVISRLSTTAFKDRPAAVDEIRRHLAANYILAGSCRISGDELTLFVELIDSRNGHVLWADSLRGNVRGVFSAEDQLIATLVAGVGSQVISNEVRRARSHSLPTLEGYTLLLGSIALMHRNSLSDSDRAKEMLEHLVERNRRHPAAHAWLGKWHVLRAQQGWSDDLAKEAQWAHDCSRRALDCDPDSPLALTIDGFVRTNLLRDLKGGAARYDEALQVNPNESLAWLLTGTLNAFLGNGEAAMAASERALRLSPLDPMRYFYDSLSASAAITAGHYDRAIELAKRSLKANRSHTSTYRALAIAQSMAGRMDEARQTVHKLLEFEPTLTVTRFLERTPARSEMALNVAQALGRAGLPQS